MYFGLHYFASVSSSQYQNVRATRLIVAIMNLLATLYSGQITPTSLHATMQHALGCTDIALPCLRCATLLHYCSAVLWASYLFVSNACPPPYLVLNGDFCVIQKDLRKSKLKGWRFFFVATFKTFSP